MSDVLPWSTYFTHTIKLPYLSELCLYNIIFSEFSNLVMNLICPHHMFCILVLTVMTLDFGKEKIVCRLDQITIRTPTSAIITNDDNYF